MSYLKFAGTVLCYAAANMVLDPQELQYFDTAMFVLLLISTMSQFFLLFALVSLSVPGSYTPDPSVSLSKTKYLVIKRCVTQSTHTDRGTTPHEECVLSSLGTTRYLPRISVKGEGQVQCDGAGGSALGGVLPGAVCSSSHLWVRTAF